MPWRLLPAWLERWTSDMRFLANAVAISMMVSVFHLHAADLPADVKAFLETRQACDHWRGEYGEGDPVRQYEINKNACALCQGMDSEFSALRKKYRRNQSVRRALKPFQEKVELPSPQAMRQACRKALSRPPEGPGVAAKPFGNPSTDTP